MRIDLLNDVGGIPFSQVWENRKDVMYEKIMIHFIGYKELLILKELAGRSQNLIDIKKLKERNKTK